MRTAGAAPNVTTSASESSSFPICESTRNKRATRPSRLSNIIPISTKIAADL